MKRYLSSYVDVLDTAHNGSCDKNNSTTKMLRLTSPARHLGIKGLRYVADFITIDEEKAFLASIDKGVWNTQLKRRTQHYGYIYDYSAKGVTTPATPIPEWCDVVIQRLLDMDIIQQRPDQMIVNEYHPGQGIFPHVDDVKSFRDGIVSLSLASPIIMDLVHNRDPSMRKEIHLSRRSIIAFHDESRYQWRHGIAARRTDYGVPRERRVSLTFRKMKHDDM